MNLIMNSCHRMPSTSSDNPFLVHDVRNSPLVFQGVVYLEVIVTSRLGTAPSKHVYFVVQCSHTHACSCLRRRMRSYLGGERNYFIKHKTSDHTPVSVSNENKSFNLLVPSHPPNMNNLLRTTAEEWFALGGGQSPSETTSLH